MLACEREAEALEHGAAWRRAEGLGNVLLLV
jgi:hypothetical protein